MFGLILIFLFVVSGLAAQEQLPKLGDGSLPQLLEENERIMRVVLSDDTVVSDGLVIYHILQNSQSHWFIPLGELSNLLQLKIMVSPKLGKAEGFIISEDREFALNLPNCTVRTGTLLARTRCDLIAPYEYDLYVDSKLLEEWFPLRITVDPFASEVFITTTEHFPIQMQAKRRDLPVLRDGEAYDPGYPNVPTPNKIFDGPFIDQQITGTRSGSKTQSQSSLAHTTNISSEVLGFEGKSHLNGDQKGVQQWTLGFSKIRPEGGLLGPVDARKIELVDHSTPSMEYISNSTYGRGASFSTYPITFSPGFSTTDFEGPLQDGYDVEIYRNEILIDRFVDNGSGRYNFRAVPLLYGRNNFRFRFYGPNGQIIEEVKTFNVDSSVLKPGEEYFRAGFIDPTLEHERYYFEFDKNILKTFNIHAGVQQLEYNKDRPVERYGLLELTGLSESILMKGSFVASQKSGFAGGLLSKFNHDQLNISAGYSRLFDFISEVYNSSGAPETEGISKLQVTHPLPKTKFTPALGSDLSAQYEEIKSTPDRLTLSHGLSTNIDVLYISHRTSLEKQSEWTYLGEVDTNFYFWEGNWRNAFTYHVDAIKSYESSYTTEFWQDLVATLGGSHNFETDVSAFTGALTRKFKYFSLALNGSYDTKENYSSSFTFQYSFGRDARNNGLYLSGEPMAGQGAASVMVFIDLNYNEIYDAGDLPLKDIAVRIEQTNQSKFVTDERGVAFLTGLRNHEPTDISIDFKTLKDPFLAPHFPGVRVIARPGTSAQVDFPIWFEGEVEGVIQKSDGESFRGLKIDLINEDGTVVKSTISEYDGYYSFSKIKGDRYFIRPNLEPLKGFHLKVEPLELSVEVARDGSVSSGNDFVISEDKSKDKSTPPTQPAPLPNAALVAKTNEREFEGIELTDDDDVNNVSARINHPQEPPKKPTLETLVADATPVDVQAITEISRQIKIVIFDDITGDGLKDAHEKTIKAVQVWSPSLWSGERETDDRGQIIVNTSLTILSGLLYIHPSPKYLNHSPFFEIEIDTNHQDIIAIPYSWEDFFYGQFEK